MGGYVIPANLRDEKDAYIFSFANRTKKNLQYIKSIALIEANEGKRGKDVTVYEVTQLINSMIGLVTFPKEAFWEKVLDNGNGQYASNKLINLIRMIEEKPSEFNYENTYLRKIGKEQLDGNKWDAYSKEKYEHLSSLSFIRHFRNAISHEKLSVYPYDINSDEDIKGFVFEDECKINVLDMGDKYIRKDSGKTSVLNQRFKIKLTVEQIENVAIDICDMFLAVAKDTYEIKEEINNFY